MKRKRPSCLLAWLIAALAVVSSAGADPAWKPVSENMMTTWGSEVTPENAWREYPRPRFERTDWQNLNGLWDYAVTPIDAENPAEWEGKEIATTDVEGEINGLMTYDLNVLKIPAAASRNSTSG